MDNNNNTQKEYNKNTTPSATPCYAPLRHLLRVPCAQLNAATPIDLLDVLDVLDVLLDDTLLVRLLVRLLDDCPTRDLRVPRHRRPYLRHARQRAKRPYSY